MEYKALVEVYENLSSTTKRLEKTDILAEFFAKTDGESLAKIVLLSLGRVFPLLSEEEQGIGSKLVMKAVSLSVGVSVGDVDDKLRDKGDIGAATEDLFKNKVQSTFFSQKLTVDKVFSNLRKIARTSGNKSQSRKINLILELLSSASAIEAKYITRTILEELRIGVGEGIVRDAISIAFDVDKALTDRAHMLTNDLGLVAEVALNEGNKGLEKLSLKPGNPVKPMLAQLSAGIKTSVEELATTICETKYDGIRIQIHKKDDEIKIFTRRLENISKAVPEVIDHVRDAFPDVDFIAEGEIIVTKDGKPISFQQILHRIRRKYDVEKAIENVPLTLYLFDLLYFKESYVDLPLKERRAKLEEIVTLSDKVRLSRAIFVTPENYEEAIDLFNESIAAGHEGIMIKDTKSPYIPGIRGKKMLKFKAEPETLDMVVVGGTYGIGKRANFIGSYQVALMGDDGELKTTAYVATGLSDDQLQELTDIMQKLKISERGTQIVVKPELILEIAYSEIVKSPDYESGYSLRFPVVKRIREDLNLDSIDTVERLKSMYVE